MRIMSMLFYKISIYLERIAGISLVFMMLIGVVDVVLRIMRVQFIGAYEWTAFACGIVVSFTIPMSFWRRGQIFLDLVYKKTPHPVQRVWIVALRMITGTIFFFISWYLFMLGADYMRTNSVSYDVNLPMPLCYFAWAMACACIAVCLVMINDIINEIRGTSHD